MSASTLTCSQGGKSLGWDRDFGPALDAGLLKVASLKPEDIPAYLTDLERSDPIASVAATALGREETLAFFINVTGSPAVAQAILDNALHFGVSPALAFALAEEESRFDPRAVNTNAGSVDRGLFQLNSRAFPKVKVADTWDPETNARYGLSHLAWFLEKAGNEVSALAMYNAGSYSVDRGATPKRTLDYISRIQAYRDKILDLYAAKIGIRAGSLAGAIALASGSN
jgi:soluble lytic murein transglycosylase-like protein